VGRVRGVSFNYLNKSNAPCVLLAHDEADLHEPRTLIVEKTTVAEWWLYSFSFAAITIRYT